MNALLLLLWLATAGWVAGADLQRTVTVRSSSGQFVVYGPRPLPGEAKPMLASTNLTINLDADTLAITAERFKQAILADLTAIDLWQGKISLVIQRFASPDQDVRIVATRSGYAWLYQVDFPEQIPPEKLARGLTKVVLQEIANRSSNGQPAEIPLWLSEGMSARLLATDGARLVVAPQTRATFQFQRVDPMRQIREHLLLHTALTFGELGQPTAEALEGEHGRTYTICAHLLYQELINLRGGKLAMWEFLNVLPLKLNWQTAFLAGFGGKFRTLLDVEKWWAIALVNATGRNPGRIWPLPLSLQKLEQTLITAAMTSQASTNLPTRTEVTLQQIVSQWRQPQQQQALRQKITQLTALRANLSPEAIPVADSYRTVLAAYLGNYQRVGYSPERKGQTALTLKSLVEDTNNKLTALDQRRAELAAAPPAPAPAPAKTGK